MFWWVSAKQAALAPEGFFALIDVFSAEAEPRDQYLERWINHAENCYVELQVDEKELLFNHVRARDFPAPLYINLFAYQGNSLPCQS